MDYSRSYGKGNYSAYAPGGTRVVDAEVAAQSTSKTPPYWEPGLERRGYPFAKYLTDVGIWSAGTELHESRMGAVVAQRLGGVVELVPSRGFLIHAASGLSTDQRSQTADDVEQPAASRLLV